MERARHPQVIEENVEETVARRSNRFAAATLLVALAVTMAGPCLGAGASGTTGGTPGVSTALTSAPARWIGGPARAGSCSATRYANQNRQVTSLREFGAFWSGHHAVLLPYIAEHSMPDAPSIAAPPAETRPRASRKTLAQRRQIGDNLLWFLRRERAARRGRSACAQPKARPSTQAEMVIFQARLQSPGREKQKRRYHPDRYVLFGSVVKAFNEEAASRAMIASGS